MSLNKVIEDFQNISQFPLADFLLKVNSFFNGEFLEIVNFYSGDSNTLDRSHIKKLNELAENSLYILQIFRNRKAKFNTIDYWDLLDAIEDIKIKLNTSQKISKYLRSSIVTGADKAGFVFESTMNMGETLEDISINKLENTDENDWSDIAKENDLKEIDYDISGGTTLKLRKNLFQADLVTSFIDNTIGEKIYGLDIKKGFNYKDGDLEVLSHNATVLQTVDILSKLTKGDIPEFREMGIKESLYKGANYSQLNYPSLSREMNRNFATDDLFRDFVIRKIEYKNGDLWIEFEVNTKYELVIVKNISL